MINAEVYLRDSKWQTEILRVVEIRFEDNLVLFKAIDPATGGLTTVKVGLEVLDRIILKSE